MGFFDTLTATAVSFTVAGNTGVTPFLTLFLVGCVERANPNLLQMDETMETLLASYMAIHYLVGGRRGARVCLHVCACP